MDLESVDQFSRLSRTLWVDPQECQAQVLETVCAVLGSGASVDGVLKRALLLLYQKAVKTGESLLQIHEYCLKGNHSSFFRLSLNQRFVLVGLHLLDASYQDLAQCMGLGESDVEKIAWRARLALSTSSAVTQAPIHVGNYCLDYDLNHPWTQRLLDDEYHPASERLALQNHILSCSPCERALHRAREIYYNVHSQVIAIEDLSEIQSLTQELRSLLIDDPRKRIRRELALKKMVQTVLIIMMISIPLGTLIFIALKYFLVVS